MPTTIAKKSLVSKGVIRIRKSKDRQHDGQIKMDNRTGHAINYKTLHINLQIE